MVSLVASSGSSVASYEYGPFGEPVRVSGAMAGANPFRFSTKYTDDETGMLYYGYRYYNPSLGRWVSRDPLGEAFFARSLASVLRQQTRFKTLRAAQIEELCFVENNPLSNIDVLGLEIDCPCCKAVDKWINSTRKLADFYGGVYKNPSDWSYPEIQAALNQMGAQTAGYAGAGATAGARPQCITDAINSVEQSVGNTVGRMGMVFAGAASDGIWIVISLGNVNPNSITSMYALEEWGAHVMLLGKLQDIKTKCSSRGW